MTLFSRIKKILEKEEACVVSKGEAPLFAVIKWERFEKMRNRLECLEELEKDMEEENSSEVRNIGITFNQMLFDKEKIVEAKENEVVNDFSEASSQEGVDINKIPV